MDPAAVTTHRDPGGAVDIATGPTRIRRARHTVKPDHHTGPRAIIRKGKEAGRTMNNRATSGVREQRVPSIPAASCCRLLAALRAGARRETAVDSAGIPWPVFMEWMTRGEQEERGRYSDFAIKVRQAEAVAEVRELTRLQRSLAYDARNAWRFLERRFPERWAPRKWPHQ